MTTKRDLIHTNPYLRNDGTRLELIISHAAASARIEGVPDAENRARTIASRIFRLDVSVRASSR